MNVWKDLHVETQLYSLRKLRQFPLRTLARLTALLFYFISFCCGILQVMSHCQLAGSGSTRGRSGADHLLGMIQTCRLARVLCDEAVVI